MEQRIESTIGAMRALADDAVEHGQAVGTAARLIAAQADQFDRDGQLHALYEWMTRRVRFVRDTAGFEHLRHPDQVLYEIAASPGRQTAIDCDDIAILSAAMLRTLGHQTYFVAAAASPTLPAHLAHVFAAIRQHGRLISFDPQERVPLGGLPPGITRLEVWRA